jgi:dymeclin
LFIITSFLVKKFPELKFKYVEEDQPEEFFVPYVWSIVYQSSGLYWIDRSVKLYPVNNIENENDT